MTSSSNSPGWIVQDRSQINLAAGPGVAIREALLKTGEADYLLFAGGKAIAAVEAKPEGYTLVGDLNWSVVRTCERRNHLLEAERLFRILNHFF